jgi:hypothetical protein
MIPLNINPLYVLNSQSGLSSARFLTKILYAFLVCPMRATCPAHLILLGLVVLLMYGEEYKS